jgi:hypothetical protein
MRFILIPSCHLKNKEISLFEQRTLFYGFLKVMNKFGLLLAQLKKPMEENAVNISGKSVLFRVLSRTLYERKGMMISVCFCVPGQEQWLPDEFGQRQIGDQQHPAYR